MIDPQKIIIALDFKKEDEVRKFVSLLGSQPVWLKIGMELYYSCGDKLIFELKSLGYKIFLDLKLHDIPNTVYSSIKSLSRLPIDMINVHGMGGLEMMKAARLAIDESSSASSPSPLLIAVTQLTSTSQQAFNEELGISGDLNNHVLHLARLAQKAGCDGVVCSPLESSILKKECGSEFKLITPGIRLKGQDNHDQKRVTTPTEALRLGSDFLVIGRMITSSVNPHEALLNVLIGE